MLTDISQNRIAELRKDAMRALLPPPSLSLADWIENNIHLPETVSALSGRVKLWSFQRGICEAIDDPDIERITLIKPVRVGFTTLLTATLANYVANSPAPILNVQPTESDCRDYMVSDIEPVFDASPSLRGLLTAENDESGRSTLLSRKFPAGSLKLIAAKSPRNFRRHTAKVLLMDEIDGMEAGAEGDPLTLAERRTMTFPDRKIICGSTPIFDHGAVSRLYAQSDMRVFEVPCPDCGDFTEIMWSHIQWDSGKPETASFACPHCGSIVAERYKAEMVSKGRWRVTKPEVQGHAGFRLNALISPHKNASWAKLAVEFLAAKNDPGTLQVFTNTLLGQPWREAAEELNETELAGRVEDFGLTRIPADVIIVTVGVDVQRDRLEIMFLGHAKNGDVFILGNSVIWGPPDEDSVWLELEDALRSTWPHPNGGTLRVDACAIDSGDGATTDKVMSYCRSRFGRRIVAIKGVTGNRPHIQASHTKGSKLFIVGVDGLKTLIVTRLSRGRSIRFSKDLEPRIFEELASERLIVRYVRGVPTRQWIRIPGKRAEGLDCLVYGLAVRNLLNLDVERRESEVSSQAEIAPKPATVIKSSWLNQGASR